MYYFLTKMVSNTPLGRKIDKKKISFIEVLMFP